MRHLLAFLIGTSLLLAGTAPAATINVPGDYPTIQAAIDAAVNGDVIQVAAGTYSEFEVDPNGKAISIIGAVDKTGAPTTIIDAQGNGGVLRCSSGETASTHFENLVLVNGSAADGAGLYVQASHPSLYNCTFQGNTASGNGGGMREANVRDRCCDIKMQIDAKWQIDSMTP